MESKKNHIINFIGKLSDGKKNVHETLNKLYSCLESHHDITIFRQNNGLKILLKLIKDNNVHLEALKMLAYCCTDNKTKLQILQWNAIPSICKLLERLKDRECLRVACKVVGNLCANRLCRISIHDHLDSLTTIVACLNHHPPSDHSFFIIYLKTLRSLSRSREHCERVVEMGAMRGVCAFLKTNLSCSLTKELLTTINHFLKRWSNEVKLQLMEAEGMRTLGRMVRKEDCLSGMLLHFILHKLLSKHELVKYFGTTGLLELLVEKYEEADIQADKDKYLSSILICCSDSSNRAAAINDTNLLQVLLTALTEPHSNHKLLLQIIVCFKYNAEATDHLITNHLIPSCIKLLNHYTYFNLPEMTSKLMYVNTEVGNSVSINTPVSPSTFTDGYNIIISEGYNVEDCSQCNTPTSSDAGYFSRSSIDGGKNEEKGEEDNVVFEAADGSHQKEETESDVLESDKQHEHPTSTKRLNLMEMTSEEEEECEDDFPDEDQHLLQMAKGYEVERRNKYVLSRVSEVCEGMHEGRRCGRKRKAKSSSNVKKIKLHSDFCLKSTLDQMTSPVQTRCGGKTDESTHNYIIDLINHLLNHPAAEKHLNRIEVLRTLIYTIPTAPNNHKLSDIFFKISQNPLYLKLLLSEMLLPMIDLFCQIDSDSPSLQTLFSGIKSNLDTVCHSNYAPAILHELLSTEHSRLPCILTLCYFLRKGSSRESYFSERVVMSDLVSCMYDHQHPLRLLAITSYCCLLNEVEDSCDCDAELDECEIEKEEVLESDYDVSFTVKEEFVKSVKSRLMYYSDVFTAMFKGVYWEASSAHVVVTDTSPEAFRFFNHSLLSGRFNRVLFEVDNCDTLLEVLQLANKYMVKELEGQIVRLVCSNLPAYFDAILASNCFLVSRPLLISCLLHICKNNSSIQKYELITYLFKYISKQDFTELSNNLIKSCCIHNV